MIKLARDLLPEAQHETIEAAKMHSPESSGRYGEHAKDVWFVICWLPQREIYVTLWRHPADRGKQIVDWDGSPVQIAAERVGGEWIH